MLSRTRPFSSSDKAADTAASRVDICPAERRIAIIASPKGSRVMIAFGAHLTMERCACRDAAAFRDCEDLVGVDIFYSLGGAAGPANFQVVRTHGLSHSEMHAEVALRQIAGAGLYLSKLNLAVDGQLQSRTDAIPIAFRANRSNQQGIMPVP